MTGPSDPRVGEPESPDAGPRRRPALSRRRKIIGALAALLLVAAGVFAVVSSDTTVNAGPPSPTSTTTTTIPVPPPAVIATTKVEKLQVFDSPATGAKVVTSLSAKTEYLLPRTLLVTEQQPGWLHVLLPIRPNGATGWIRESDVTLASTSYSIKIELAAHKVTLYNAGAVALESAAVIGTDRTPTPLGEFYVTDPVDLQKNPGSAYGAFALGFSGYSEVLLTFNGGPGQIALHGTPRPDQVGQNLSNGCIRIPNDIILQIAKLVPLGTPVTIVA